jgi:hypothetical protein
MKIIRRLIRIFEQPQRESRLVVNPQELAQSKATRRFVIFGSRCMVLQAGDIDTCRSPEKRKPTTREPLRSA